MYKLLTILFFLGAIGGFGLSTRSSYEYQSQSMYGVPMGEAKTHQISQRERNFFMGLGFACMIGGIVCLAKARPR